MAAVRLVQAHRGNADPLHEVMLQAMLLVRGGTSGISHNLLRFNI
jgi:hypothetical protein